MTGYPTPEQRARMTAEPGTPPAGPGPTVSPAGTVAEALAELTAQARRIADALTYEPPTREDIVGAVGLPPRHLVIDTPTPDADALRDARRDSLLVLLSQAQRGVLTPDEGALLRQHVEAEIRDADTERTEFDVQWERLAADRDQLAEANARIRRALDPDDETYIRETVDDQLALTKRAQQAERDRDQYAAVLREVLDQFANWPAGGTLWPEAGVVAKVSTEEWDRWDAVATPTARPWWEQVATYEQAAVEATQHVLELKAVNAEAQQVIEMQKELIGSYRRIAMTAMDHRENQGARIEHCDHCGRDHMAELDMAIHTADLAYAKTFPATADGPRRPGRLPAAPDVEADNEQLRQRLDRIIGHRSEVEAERDRLAATIERMKRTNRMVNGGARDARQRAEAILDRVRMVGPDLELAATAPGLAEPAREAMRAASRRIRAALDGSSPAPVDDDYRQQLVAALIAEHTRRAREQVVASPEEHCAAFADAVLGIRDRKVETLRHVAQRNGAAHRIAYQAGEGDRAAIARVRALHRSYDDGKDHIQRCFTCVSTEAYPGTGVAIHEPWPCPTIATLDAPAPAHEQIGTLGGVPVVIDDHAPEGGYAEAKED